MPPYVLTDKYPAALTCTLKKQNVFPKLVMRPFPYTFPLMDTIFFKVLAKWIICFQLNDSSFRQNRTHKDPEDPEIANHIQ